MPLTAVRMLTLEFTCCRCGNPVNAILRCEGELDAVETTIGLVLECPTCDAVNQVEFAKDGVVIGVRPPRRLPEMIWN